MIYWTSRASDQIVINFCCFDPIGNMYLQRNKWKVLLEKEIIHNCKQGLIKGTNAKMLVPEHKYVVSMFLATAGTSGHLLGSDEKEIIYLVFGIINLQTKEVSDHRRQTRAFYLINSWKTCFEPIVRGNEEEGLRAK